MENFSDVAKSAWSTDDGKTTFCVPMASVIHGSHEQQGRLQEDRRRRAQDDGRIPRHPRQAEKGRNRYADRPRHRRSMGSGYYGLPEISCPITWAGETGRAALISGKEKFTDPGYVAVFKELATWDLAQPPRATVTRRRPIPTAITSRRSARRRSIPPVRGTSPPSAPTAKFPIGAFAPPLPAGDKDCDTSDHTDIAMGVNSASKNKDDAKKFLEWLTTPEFATLYAMSRPASSCCPRKRSRSTTISPRRWSAGARPCKSTIRDSYQILSRGTPKPRERAVERAPVQVINGAMTPDAAGKQLQDGLDKWYKPAK